MAKLPVFIWLILSSLLATAQGIEQRRWLAGDYQPQPVEQAIVALTAGNTIGAGIRTTYKAGQSVVLNAGFEAKAGSVFLAHTAVVSGLTTAELGIVSLTLSAYPNPFDQVTTITYVLTKSGRTSLHINDADGKLIRQLVEDRYQEAGHYTVEWKETELSAGLYVCTLQAGSQRIAGRIIRK